MMFKILCCCLPVCRWPGELPCELLCEHELADIRNDVCLPPCMQGDDSDCHARMYRQEAQKQRHCNKQSEHVHADPARAGLGAPLVDLLLKLRADRILYISCNPPTQVCVRSALR